MPKFLKIFCWGMGLIVVFIVVDTIIGRFIDPWSYPACVIMPVAQGAVAAFLFAWGFPRIMRK